MPPVLRLADLSLAVGSAQLLDSATALLADGQRVALVGPNGAGKSTLLRVLADPDSAPYAAVTAGACIRVCGADRVLLVEQDALRWSRLLGGDEDDWLELPLPDALESAVGDGDAVDIERAVDDAEAWRRLSVAADDVLAWRTAEYDTTPLGQLSPGCAVRAYLAVALNRRGVDLLCLDEPTNHLDLPSILWLQAAIAASGKAVVMVSHDEAFLDAVATHVWSIDPVTHGMAVSGAGYSAFRRAEGLAREQQRAAFDAQQKRHERLSGVADKLRAASAAGARHVAKDHDTMQRDFKRDRAGRSGGKAKAIETLRDAEPRVERVVDRAPLKIEIDPLEGGGDAAIVVAAAVLGFDGQPLPLPPLSLRVDFGERFAVVGFNGVGKSTLLKTITGVLPPVSGEVTVGRELRIGNLTQEHETLPRAATPRKHIIELTGAKAFDAHAKLIKFGLSRRQVDCPIGELNPGARARVLLATFSMRRVNCLVLDEPTNHLDGEAIAEVVATLNEFAGTVLVVTHSRTFLDELRLTRTLRLGPDGLAEVESIDAFIEATDEAAQKIVDECARV